MKIPNKLKVGSHVYKVELRKSKDGEKGRGNWGKTFLEEKKVLIDMDMPDSLNEETLLHEIIHIAMDQSCLNLDLDHEVKLSEEQVVTRLTTPLYDILKENKLHF